MGTSPHSLTAGISIGCLRACESSTFLCACTIGTCGCCARLAGPKACCACCPCNDTALSTHVCTPFLIFEYKLLPLREQVVDESVSAHACIPITPVHIFLVMTHNTHVMPRHGSLLAAGYPACTTHTHTPLRRSCKCQQRTRESEAHSPGMTIAGNLSRRLRKSPLNSSRVQRSPEDVSPADLLYGLGCVRS